MRLKERIGSVSFLGVAARVVYTSKDDVLHGIFEMAPPCMAHLRKLLYTLKPKAFGLSQAIVRLVDANAVVPLSRDA